MKKIKIILPISVVAIIGAFVWWWWVGTSCPPPPPPIENLFTKKIQSDIDSLENVPKNVFCKGFYNHIQSEIKEFHRDSSLGVTYKGSKEIKSAVNNEQWKDILSKNLYSTYVSKFIDQAMYVFNGSEWKDADLNFIRSEVQVLKRSTYLELTSPVANSLNSIINILAKYDEINGFVSGCNNFKFPDYSIASRYPNVSEKVKKSRAYLANNLDNPYVNKCTRLKNSLQLIPKVLFYKHFGYLMEKINEYAAKYRSYNLQITYVDSITKPLKEEQVDVLDNAVYGISDPEFDNAKKQLLTLLDHYNIEAYNYFKKQVNVPKGG